MEEPASDAENYDDVEREIISVIEREFDRSKEKYNDEMRGYSDRLSSIDLEEPVSSIKIISRDALSKIQANLSGGADKLFNSRYSLIGIRRELENFRSNNGLENRNAHYPESRILHYGVLLLFLCIEAIMNGFFLGETHTFGLLGGFSEAVIIAIVNVSIGFIVGLFFLRQLFHRNIFRKLIGGLFCIAYFSGILLFNLAVAHYRDVLAGGNWEVAHLEVIPRLLSDPLAVSDIKSWLLFGVGVLFSIFALVDGLTVDDLYPNYGPLWREHKREGEDYAEVKDECMGDLEEVQVDAIERLEETREQWKQDRGEYERIINFQNRLHQSYIEHISALQRVGNELLGVYRKTNQKYRSTPSPTHFQDAWTLQAEIPANPPGVNQQKLEDASKQLNAVLEEELDKIHQKYDEGVAVYKKIEELTEEELRSGSAQDIIEKT
ncbi:hypothetical protein ACFOW6_12120 [Fodinicurvata halophila]|uniref:Transmembrane protein n=1 Tax=Fodinicurvata halophila TaxID=1419723 RepID=A0ABV8UNH0_9PROT